MADPFTGAVASLAVNSGFTSFKKYSKYFLCFNTYVQDLKEKVRALEVKKQGVLNRVREGEINNEIQDDEVTEWLKKAENVARDRNNILAKIDRSKSSCFCPTVPKESDGNTRESMTEVDKFSKSSIATGGFVLNPRTRWRTSRKAEKVAKDASDLEKKSFERYTHPSEPRGIVTGSYEDVDPKYFFPASRQTILKDINEALANPKISVVGVWGPSGVGKSTLLELVVKHVKEKKFGYDFGGVAKATVSRAPDIERIQEELADWLGLKELKDHNSVDSKANALRTRFGGKSKSTNDKSTTDKSTNGEITKDKNTKGKRSKDESTTDKSTKGERTKDKNTKGEITEDKSTKDKKYLVILDDVAKKIDLSKIGIPFKAGENIKLLLTSRSEAVLQREMASELNFKLGPFEEEEAFKFFKWTLNKDVVEDGEQSKSIKGLLANECAGLPLSIIQLANLLRNSSSEKWKDILKKLPRSTDLGVKNFIDEMLESSYGVIDSKEIKSLFLLCGQIGTQIISVEKLVIYSMGLGIFEGIDTIQEARAKVDSLLEKLKSYCLVVDEKPGFFKIHDAISDAALDIAAKDQHSVVIRSEDQLMRTSIKEDLLRCKSISVLNVSDIKELPQGLSCPELNMFSWVFTEDRATKFKLPGVIFQDMKKLKVLVLFIVDLVPLPQSIQFLHQLQTLCLDSCDIEDFTFLGKLRRLQVLIIRNYKMFRLPKEIAELTDLRVLDLRTCDGPEIIEQGILGSLTRLEELLLPKSFERWDEEGIRQPTYASITELKNMPSLSALQIKIPDVTALPNDLPLVNLMRFSLYAGYTSDSGNESPAVHFNEERTLALALGSGNSRFILEDFVQNASQKARELHLSGWVGIEKSVAALFKERCAELKHIEVQGCPTIEYIIDLDQQTQFPSLESLDIRDMVNLNKIFSGGLIRAPFCDLRAITITNCESLEHLFPFSLMNKLSNKLEKFEVVGCDMLRDIVTITEEGGDVVQTENKYSNCEPLEFTALRELSLKFLPKVLSFCTKQNGDMIETNDNSISQRSFFHGRRVSFPCLESLTLKGLSGFTKIADHQHLPNLQSLKSLSLEWCDSLSSAIESKLLLMLTNLEELSIQRCDSMEAVFELEDELSIKEVIKHGPLSLKPDVLTLSHLKRLKKIWNETPNDISFVVNLKQLKIDSCNELTYLFSSSMAKSLNNLSSLLIRDCDEMKGVFVDETSVDEHDSFDLPSLKELVIERCPKMNSFISVENTSEDVPIKESFFSSKVLLPSLESLVLEGAGEFKSVWDSIISEESFHMLTSVCIKRCKWVTVIFPSIVVEGLQHLKENTMLSKLNRMELEELGSLKRIVMTNSIPNKIVLGLPSLTGISIRNCDNLINLFDTATAKRLGFPSLTDISIRNCDNLINLFDTATAKRLSELKNLEIDHCRNMKEVVSENEGDENRGWDMMAFDKLSSLKLCDLDKLTHFCSGCFKLYCPVLKTLYITGCESFKAFTPGCESFKAFTPKLVSPVGHKDTDSGIGSAVDNEDGVFSPLFDDKVMLPNLQHVQIEGLQLKEIWHDKFPSGSFCKLQVLEVVGCRRISIVIPSFMLHNLEKLTVRSCETVEVIFQLDEHTLRRRKLARSTVFELKSLEVDGCPRLRNLFTTSSAKILKKLEELTITKCKKMEVIVAWENMDHEGGPHKIVFPQLSVLRLVGMPALVSFWAEKHTTEWPSLKRIEIKDCNAIMALMAKSLEHGIPFFLVEKESSRVRENKLGAFPKLESIKVDQCTNLLTIFPSSIVGGFRNLEVLNVWDCERLKELFEVEDHSEESTSADSICFGKLREIVIGYCSGLEQVFPTSVARCLHRLQTLKICNCERIKEIVVWKGECNNKDDEENVWYPMFFFPKLISLALEHMPLLESFYRGLHSTKWPLLETLLIMRCPKAKILSSEQEGWNNNDEEIHLRLEEKANSNDDDEIPSFKATKITMDMLQIPDEIIGNPTSMYLRHIKDEATVKDFPWRLLLERPHNLEKLQIYGCEFEEIFTWSGNRGVDGHGQESDEIVPFPCRLLIENIRHLSLEDLPKLKHMWKEPEGSALLDILDIVESLEVTFCPLLTGILFPSSSSSYAFANSFNNLKSLTIGHCNGLRHVMTSSTARCLVHLEELRVLGCDNVEEIVTDDDDYEEDFNKGDQKGRARPKDITFHHLRNLTLKWLPRLRSFSSSISCNLNFPCLVNIDSKGMEFIFCKGMVRAPLLSKEKRRKVGIQN